MSLSEQHTFVCTVSLPTQTTKTHPNKEIKKRQELPFILAHALLTNISSARIVQDKCSLLFVLYLLFSNGLYLWHSWETRVNGKDKLILRLRYWLPTTRNRTILVSIRWYWTDRCHSLKAKCLFSWTEHYQSIRQLQASWPSIEVPLFRLQDT